MPTITMMKPQIAGVVRAPVVAKVASEDIAVLVAVATVVVELV